MFSAATQLSTRLVEPARWLIVIGIAYSLATTALYFLSAPQGEQTPDKHPYIPAADTNTKSEQRIEDILAHNLFGNAKSTATPDQPLKRALETRLPLKLHGVFVADNSDTSATIVAQKGKAGILYRVSDTLPGNAVLLEVHTDHIVLRRGGTRETLTFPQVKDSQSLTTQTQASAILSQATAQTAISPHDAAANYRTMIDENPSEVLSMLGIAAVDGDASSGYRVSDLADSPYFSQTGLQAGDVILSVNGRPVGDIHQDRMEIDNVLAQRSARLEIQRGTRRFFVTTSL